MSGNSSINENPETFETSNGGAACILDLNSNFSDINNINFYQHCSGSSGNPGLCEINAQSTQQLNQFINDLNENPASEDNSGCSSTTITIKDTGQTFTSWESYMITSSYQGKFKQGSTVQAGVLSGGYNTNVIVIIVLLIFI